MKPGTGKIAVDYLPAHPGTRVKVSQKLHQQQHEREQLAMRLKPGGPGQGCCNVGDRPERP